MLRGIRSRLTYANVMATAAFFIAVGGSAYAAASLAPNSVGTAQIKNGAVTNPKLANGAVTPAKSSGLILGTGSIQDVNSHAAPGGSTPVGKIPGVGTLTGTCNNPCMQPMIYYQNTSHVNELVQFTDYSGVEFYNLAPGGTTPSSILAGSSSSGIDSSGVYVAEQTSHPLELYFGSFVQWASSGASWYSVVDRST